MFTNLCLDEEGSLIKVEASSKYSKATAWKYLSDRNTNTCSSCKSDKFTSCQTKNLTLLFYLSYVRRLIQTHYSYLLFYPWSRMFITFS